MSQVSPTRASTADNTPLNLDPLTLPLRGRRLIEASAGTGKTYTIANLYLRLLLDHGDQESKPSQALNVENILVVTFTEAATAELRERIRARIHQARLAFSRGTSDDPFITQLLNDIANQPRARSILLQAERQMDEAAIFTIHGFCQRMLTQNAFESNSRFDNEFITNEQQLMAEVTADYWRRTFYSMPPIHAAMVHQIWQSPQALLNDISKHLSSMAELAISSSGTELKDIFEQQIADIDRVKKAWREHRDGLIELIESCQLDGRSYRKDHLENWLAEITEWARVETASCSLPAKLEKFSQSLLLQKSKGEKQPQHSVFCLIEDLVEQPPDIKTPMILHAIEHCRNQLAATKARRQVLSFDDLLWQFDQALNAQQENLLSRRIQQLYPLAMIDEFQDTDPLQYRIFDQLYPVQPGLGLLMIGDPKQAIYSFRGADIFTYIRARQALSARYTLSTNWRSSATMIAAVNQLFKYGKRPFIYDNDIPFSTVSHSPKAEQRGWWLKNQAQAALTYWQYEGDVASHQQQTQLPLKLVNKGDYQRAMADASALKIAEILIAAKANKAYIKDGNDPREQTIKAGDIAILVRTGSEAAIVKKALLKRGIASVFLSNKDSVFKSSMALDLLFLLRACLYPERTADMRTSLATELMGLTAAQIRNVNNDEDAWENQLQQFKHYHNVWQRRGVLPMLRLVMKERNVAERLLATEQGEASLTNLMHLSELLQQASIEAYSDSALLRWFKQCIEGAQQVNDATDDTIQRLESEQNLVQIITIHKSKGLEYPLVFLPFVMAFRETTEARYYDAKKQKTVVDLAFSEASKAQAQQERLAEDLRLLYVALTRAVYGCFVGVAAIADGKGKQVKTSTAHSAALGYLLQQGKIGDGNTLSEAIDQQISLATTEEVIRQPIPQADETLVLPPVIPATTLTANHQPPIIDTDWRMTSYSGIIKQAHHHQGVLEQGALEADQQAHQWQSLLAIDVDGNQGTSADQQQASETQSEHSIFNFPRGARAGTFLHTVFEEIDFSQPAESEENKAVITQLLEDEQYPLHWLPCLLTMVNQVLCTPLDGNQLQLKGLSAQQRLVELEFLLPIETLNADSLNSAIQQHDPLSARAGTLTFDTIKGMLKGFIDLVFEYQGRYYVLDWKSNHLGDQVEDYHQPALHDAMAAHRYDLQYQIYALALHRFLRSRLANYQYQQHFGGVYYLFLRGINGSNDYGIFQAKPSQALLAALDQLLDDQLHQASEQGELREQGQQGKSND